MNFNEYRYLVYSDLYRTSGKIDRKTLLSNICTGEMFKYIFWMRTCRFLIGKPWARLVLFRLAHLMYNHYTFKFGIDIPFMTEIGPGFYIGHFSGIFIYQYCHIGRNCCISQGVTVGLSPRGKNAGYPVLGDNVYIGPGAKVIGNIRVGNNVAIGANAVVTRDLPDNAVAVGIPAQVISYDGSDGYVILTDYDQYLTRVN
jgi:serine O-acetyltransferase